MSQTISTLSPGITILAGSVPSGQLRVAASSVADIISFRIEDGDPEDWEVQG